MRVVEPAFRQRPATPWRRLPTLRLAGNDDAERLLRELHLGGALGIRRVRRGPTDPLHALLHEFLTVLADRRRTRGLFGCPRWRDVEVQLVKTLVLQLLSSLGTPLDYSSWPVRISTLGHFEVRIDGAVLHPPGKVQRKPIALAKVLIALGGRDIPADKVIDILWSEPSEGDGQKAFDITVHRLRKLLGFGEAVQVADRRVTLSSKVVWVDAWSLEETLAPLIAAVNAAEPDIFLLEAAAPQVLNLYRGHFLAGESEEAWQIPIRNRLASRFQRFAMRLGEHWESQQQWPRALELYQRAVELDPLAESFYRRQMTCLGAHGQRAEAIEVYRRCRQVLSVTLGVAPAGETEAVYRQLLAS